MTCTDPVVIAQPLPGPSSSTVLLRLGSVPSLSLSVQNLHIYDSATQSTPYTLFFLLKKLTMHHGLHECLPALWTTDPRLSMYIDDLLCIMMYGSNVYMDNIGERRLADEFDSFRPDDSTV